MRRAWARPETIIVDEWCWNSLAKHADIVLPCTTPLERSDIALTPKDPYQVVMDQAIQPGWSRPNGWAEQIRTICI